MLRAGLPAIGAFVASLAFLAGPAVASTASASFIDPCAPDDVECELGGDRFVCGPGVDTIQDVNPADVLARDCERVNLGLLLDEEATMRPYSIKLPR